MRLTKRTPRQLIKLVLIIVVSLGGWTINRYPHLFGGSIQQVPLGSYRVRAVNDGDTIQVNMNEQTETIRLIGVDTPETHDPRKAVQCFGRAATTYTADLIGNQPVRLEADPLSTGRDRYNRLLRYVYLPDGRLVQAEIIKNGYGFAYTSFPFTKSEEFTTFEKEAREAGRGLWSDCQPVQNQYGGYSSNPEK